MAPVGLVVAGHAGSSLVGPQPPWTDSRRADCDCAAAHVDRRGWPLWPCRGRTCVWVVYRWSTAPRGPTHHDQRQPDCGHTDFMRDVQSSHATLPGGSQPAGAFVLGKDAAALNGRPRGDIVSI